MLKRKVLIIDDETDFCLLLKSYFLRRQYEVFLSYSLTQGMQLMEQVMPDIIFLDNNLPDGYGWEKLDYIRKKLPLTDVNLISAYQHDLPAKNYSGVHVWEKPLALSELNKIF